MINSHYRMVVPRVELLQTLPSLPPDGLGEGEHSAQSIPLPRRVPSVISSSIESNGVSSSGMSPTATVHMQAATCFSEPTKEHGPAPSHLLQFSAWKRHSLRELEFV